MVDLHVFVCSAGCYHVIAESPDDVRAVFVERGERLEHYPNKTFRQLPDDQQLTIVDDPHKSRCGIRQTCGAWAREMGRGFLCSTEY